MKERAEAVIMLTQTRRKELEQQLRDAQVVGDKATQEEIEAILGDVFSREREKTERPAKP